MSEIPSQTQPPTVDRRRRLARLAQITAVSTLLASTPMAVISGLGWPTSRAAWLMAIASGLGIVAGFALLVCVWWEAPVGIVAAVSAVAALAVGAMLLCAVREPPRLIGLYCWCAHPFAMIGSVATTLYAGFVVSEEDRLRNL